MAKDYYQILGISKDASEADIKQAYRKLSRELHPDKHKGDKGKEEQFKQVNEAYEVLSDPAKRKRYDQFGSADGPFQGGTGGFGGFQGFEGFNFQNADFGGFGDLFDSFFGGTRARRPNQAGRDIEVNLTISFADAVKGLEKEITFRTLATCPHCHGSGGEPGTKQATCPDCSGTGQVLRQTSSLFGMIQQRSTCPRCKGSGKVPEEPCKTCKGEGRTQQEKTVRVNIPAGIADGQSLKLSGQGEAGRAGAAAGDLYVHVQITRDPRFSREENDIYSSIDVPLTGLLLGTHVPVETVHGKVEMEVPAGTQPGQILRIRGKGMPMIGSSKAGDHYVTVQMQIPKKLSKEQKQMLEKLKETGL